MVISHSQSITSMTLACLAAPLMSVRNNHKSLYIFYQMTDISSRLQEFDSLEGFDEKVVRYNELVSELVERQNVTGLKMTAAHCLHEWIFLA